MADLESPVVASDCVHRWIITTPVGDLCGGTCRLCGAERSFTNERYAFGQAGRTRRTVPQVRTKPIARAVESGGLAQFFARSEVLTVDAAGPLQP